ncbi:late transcription factor VLTF-3 [Canarypox virus]|uniref:Viral late gene transcription factor 3 n=4 Tax=Avipoxvirus TaxID=10260 RepID=A0A1V0QGI2_CNPV|nr:late transcription factor VLTF-3 [Canarypox virus]ARE67475.1 SWPV2-ORF224 [Shearwaterpox virus]QGM48871.1 late transcription factor VLTF-3 [Magpiepox virus]QRM15517.1 late transcription factor VLTF-3 [Mudlarkpox virus]QRM15870.1 late transcription factor vltf-3 [Penguinpox virus 2]QRM16207.1 late transcription factor vltf-3 [Albatrosspox virus]QZW33569.1 MPPV-247 late transcription factor VLTF-3 [Magpiepox virus 2]UOX38812.1 late transcription factor VLTF-3 [Finch poxvirus]UWX11406.1 CRP
MRNLKSCSNCKHNGLITEYNHEFCIFCQSVFQLSNKVSKKSNFHVSNKLIHLRNVLRRLLSNQCSSDVITELRTVMNKNNISSKDIDANFVSSFLKANDKINKKDYKLVFEIINHIKEEKLNLDTNKINEVIEIFKHLVFFCQENTSSKTINYSFFLDKIFNLTSVTSNLKPQTVKNYTKNNSNQLVWENFLEYMKNKKINTLVHDYGHEYVFVDYGFTTCSLEV